MAKSTKYSGNQDNWFVADLETTTAESNYYKTHNDVVVILANLLSWDESENFQFTNLDDFMEFLVKAKKSATVFFHNLTFDGNFLIKFLMNKFNVAIDFENNKHTRLEVFKNDGTLYSIKLYIKSKDWNFIINFRCSYKLLSSSVASLGKDLGINKHTEKTSEKDFYDLEPVSTLDELPQEYKDYCKRDCLIVLKALKTLNNQIFETKTIKEQVEQGVKFSFYDCLTAGALSRKLMTQIYLPAFNKKHESKIKLDISARDYQRVEKFMSGGFTQFHPDFLGNKIKEIKGKVIDINSSYPTQMCKDLPYGKILNIKPLNHYIEFLEIKVKSAKIKENCKNVVCLKNWKHTTQERYVRNLEKFNCYYIKEEWDLLNKYYDFEVEKITSFYMASTPYLKDMMEEIYFYKSDFKSQGKPAQALIYKIILNSGYGKLATREKYNSLIWSKKELFPDEVITINGKEYEVKGESKQNNITDNYGYTVSPLLSKEQLTNKAAASVITARARIQLLETILKLGPENFIYCDTDSVFYRVTDKNKNVVDLGKNLGQWDEEAEFDTFSTYGAKKYLAWYENKIAKSALSGLKTSKEILDNIDFTQEQFTINNAVLQKVEKHSGILLVSKNKTFMKGEL